MANALVAKGITVTFSGFSADLIDIDGPGFERESIDITHQGSGSWREKVPSPFANGKPIVLTVAYNGSLNGPSLITANPDPLSTLTLTLPVPRGLTNGAQHSVLAFITDISPTGSLGEKMTAQVTFEPTGEPTFTAAS